MPAPRLLASTRPLRERGRSLRIAGRTVRRTLLAFGLAGWASAGAGLAAAENLLANGSFPPSTVSPWTDDQFGSIAWTSRDFQLSASSGAMLVSDDNGSSFYATVARSECLAISPATELEVGGFFAAGASRPTGSLMNLGRYYYSDASCSAPISGSGTGYVQVPASGWYYLFQVARAPANAIRMRVEIAAGSGTTALLELVADGLFVRSHVLFADGFESGDTSAFSGGGSALPQAGAGETCGSAIPVQVLDPEFLYEGTTEGYAADYAFSAGTCPGETLGYGAAAPDVVFSFTAPDSDLYRVELAPSGYDSTLYAATSCAPTPSSCLGADEVTGTHANESLLLQLTGGQTVYIFVDGFSNVDPANAGVFALTVDRAP